MQRKNSFLGRNAMAMIMAMVVIVIIATIVATGINLTTKTTKRTVDVYLYEQSALYAKSAIERALLEIAKAQPCALSELSYTYDGIYDVNVTMQYVYDSNASCVANGGTFYTTVATPEQNGSVLMDVSVEVNTSSTGSEPIRYFRRTMQKL